MKKSNYKFILLFSFWAATAAFSFSWEVGGGRGWMQQPASSRLHLATTYYLLVHPTEGTFVRGQYTQRPTFTTEGFQDQETFFSGVLGVTLETFSNQNLNWGVGVGTAKGFVKALNPTPISPVTERKYTLHGISTQIFYEFDLSFTHLTLGYEVFTGLSNKTQMLNYIAWPFHIFYLQFGLGL